MLLPRRPLQSVSYSIKCAKMSVIKTLDDLASPTSSNDAEFQAIFNAIRQLNINVSSLLAIVAAVVSLQGTKEVQERMAEIARGDVPNPFSVTPVPDKPLITTP